MQGMTSTTPPTPAGGWRGRPAGLPGVVPPPSVPLSYLGAASLGAVGLGVALIAFHAVAVGDPSDDRVVAAAHLAMLATLSMGVLGALHQFTPVITQRPLHSVPLARATFFAWLAGAWLLPVGFATRHETLVEVGGAFAAIAVVLLVVNLWHALAVRHKGAPVMALRLALGGFVATACYGVIYVIDRRGQWFDLSGHVVLAHVVVGVFAWLGLSYVGVAEKLWPMFMLAHVPGRRWASWLAVSAIPAGVALLSPGLLFGVAGLAWCGAALVVSGLAAHLVSLARHVRHRRRATDVHLVFVLSAAGWLVAGLGLALAAQLVIAHDHHRGVALVAASITAFGGWLLVALVGHAHKVVPFILWSSLRGRGIQHAPDGRQLMFADLFSHRWYVADYVLVMLAVGAVDVGFAASLGLAIAFGGACLIATGLSVAINLSWRSLRLITAARHDAPVPDRLPATS